MAASYLDQAAECIKASGSKGATLPALKKFVAAARGAGYVNGTFLLQLRNAVKKGSLLCPKGTCSRAAFGPAVLGSSCRSAITSVLAGGPSAITRTNRSTRPAQLGATASLAHPLATAT